MNYKFKSSEKFWEKFHQLSSAEKASIRYAWGIFKENPFDPRLKTHRIHHLSAESGRTIFSVCVEEDLRILFYRMGDTFFTFDIGTHDIYK